MTLSELAKTLRARELSMTMWYAEDWCVWLFCADDPALGIFPGEGDTIDEAIERALAQWDRKYPEAQN